MSTFWKAGGKGGDGCGDGGAGLDVEGKVVDVRGAEIAEGGLHGLQFVEAAGAEQEFGAVPGEFHGGGCADAGAGAGDEDELVFEGEGHGESLLEGRE